MTNVTIRYIKNMKVSEFYGEEIKRLSGRVAEDFIDLLERHSESFEDLLHKTQIAGVSTYLGRDNAGNPCFNIGGGNPWMFTQQSFDDFIDCVDDSDGVENMDGVLGELIERLTSLREKLASES